MTPLLLHALQDSQCRLNRRALVSHDGCCRKSCKRTERGRIPSTFKSRCRGLGRLPPGLGIETSNRLTPFRGRRQPAEEEEGEKEEGKEEKRSSIIGAMLQVTAEVRPFERAHVLVGISNLKTLSSFSSLTRDSASLGPAATFVFG